MTQISAMTPAPIPLAMLWPFLGFSRWTTPRMWLNPWPRMRASFTCGLAMRPYSGCGARCKRSGVTALRVWRAQCLMAWTMRVWTRRAGVCVSAVGRMQICLLRCKQWSGQQRPFMPGSLLKSLLSKLGIKTAASPNKAMWPRPWGAKGACAAPACPAGAKTPPETKRVRRLPRYCQANSTCPEVNTL